MVEGWLVSLFALLCPAASAPGTAADGRVLEVPANETVQSALWNARPGDRLRLSGRHEERIFPQFDITLEAGEDGSLVGRDGPALSVGPGITVRVAGLLLERTNTPGLPGGPVVLVRDGGLQLLGTRLVAAQDEALRIAGHGHARLDDTILQGLGAPALRVLDRGLADIEGGRVSGEGPQVVHVSEHGSLRMVDGLVVGRRTLIRGEDDSRLTAGRMRLEGGEVGIELAQRAKARLYGTTLKDQRGLALALGDQTDLAVADATVSPAVGMALALNGDATLTSRRTRWTGQPGRAGLMGGQARWLGSDDAWEGWPGEGVTIADMAGLAHHGLRVRRLERPMIQATGHGHVVLTNADAEGFAEDGLVLTGEARLHWLGGRLSQTGRDAVVAGGRTLATLDGVRLEANGRHGIVGDDEAQLTLRKVRLGGFREVSLLLRNRSRAVATELDIEGHKGTGAAAIGDARMALDSAEIKGGRVGVLFLDRADGELRNCRISDHAVDGVVVQDMAHPRLQGLEVRGQGQAGVRILDGARPVLDRSVLVGNGIGVSVEAPGRSRGQPRLGMNRVVDNTLLDHEGLLPGPVLTD